PLRAIVLDDVQDYAASLTDVAPATRPATGRRQVAAAPSAIGGGQPFPFNHLRAYNGAPPGSWRALRGDNGVPPLVTEGWPMSSCDGEDPTNERPTHQP